MPMMSKRIIFFIFALSCSYLTLTAQQFYRGEIALDAVKLYKSASIQTQLGNTEIAKNLFLKALDADYRFVEAMDKLGEIYRLEGSLDSAVYYFEMSLDREPEGILAYQNLAATYQLQGRYDEAIALYEDLLSLFPNYTEAYFGLGKLFLEKKDYFRSQLYANTALKKFNEEKLKHRAADARLLAAQSYLGDRNYKKAIKYLKANKKYTAHKAFHPYYVGYCYLKLGIKEKAFKHLEKAQSMGYQLPVYIKEQLSL